MPENVTSIDDSAFFNCSHLSAIFLPKTINELGKYVFRNCENLAIYTEFDTKPSNWNTNWNFDNNEVFWGYNITEGLNYEDIDEYTCKLIGSSEL